MRGGLVRPDIRPLQGQGLDEARPWRTIAYVRDIKPIFDRDCVECHGGREAAQWRVLTVLARWETPGSPVSVAGLPLAHAPIPERGQLVTLMSH
jgi:hypothetical protein